jgi:hypothetical protein
MRIVWGVIRDFPNLPTIDVMHKVEVRCIERGEPPFWIGQALKRLATNGDATFSAKDGWTARTRAEVRGEHDDQADPAPRG